MARVLAGLGYVIPPPIQAHQLNEKEIERAMAERKANLERMARKQLRASRKFRRRKTTNGKG